MQEPQNQQHNTTAATSLRFLQQRSQTTNYDEASAMMRDGKSSSRADDHSLQMQGGLPTTGMSILSNYMTQGSAAAAQ